MSAAFSAGAIAFTLFDMRLGGERSIGKIFGEFLKAIAAINFLRFNI